VLSPDVSAEKGTDSMERGESVSRIPPSSRRCDGARSATRPEYKTCHDDRGGDGYAGDRGRWVARDRRSAPRLAGHRAGPRSRVAHPVGLLPVLHDGAARTLPPFRPLALARLASVHPRLVVLPSELSVVLRAVLPPLVTAYAIFVAMVVLRLQRPVPRPHAPAAGSPGAHPRRPVVRTMLGGYVAFLVIVLIFHVWLAEDPGAFASAALGGAFLSLITLVVAAGAQLLGGGG